MIVFEIVTWSVTAAVFGNAFGANPFPTFLASTLKGTNLVSPFLRFPTFTTCWPFPSTEIVTFAACTSWVAVTCTKLPSEFCTNLATTCFDWAYSAACATGVVVWAATGATANPATTVAATNFLTFLFIVKLPPKFSINILIYALNSYSYNTNIY